MGRSEEQREHVLQSEATNTSAIRETAMSLPDVETFVDRRTFNVRDVVSARAARGALVKALEQRASSAVDTLRGEVVLSELIANVIRHAGENADVEVAIDCTAAHVVLHVLDRGPGFRHVGQLPSDLYSESGRGLFLVAALTDELTVTGRPDGGSHVRAVFGSTSAPRP